MLLTLRPLLSTVQEIVNLLTTSKGKNMPGFTNHYIEQLMYKISTKPSHFKGVHACDIFLDKVNKKTFAERKKLFHYKPEFVESWWVTFCLSISNARKSD